MCPFCDGKGHESHDCPTLERLEAIGKAVPLGPGIFRSLVGEMHSKSQIDRWKHESMDLGSMMRI